MEAAPENVKVRSSYNLSAMSFSPSEIAREIKVHYPSFKIKYNPDFRQKIAESWPSSIDDSSARADWGWNHSYGVAELVETMIANLKAEMVFD